MKKEIKNTPAGKYWHTWISEDKPKHKLILNEYENEKEYLFESEDVIILFERKLLRAKFKRSFTEEVDSEFNPTGEYWLNENWYCYGENENVDDLNFHKVKNWMYLPPIDCDEWINVEEKKPDRETSPLDEDQSIGGLDILVKVTKGNTTKIITAWYDFELYELNEQGLIEEFRDEWRTWELVIEGESPPDLYEINSPRMYGQDNVWIITHWMPLIKPEISEKPLHPFFLKYGPDREKYKK